MLNKFLKPKQIIITIFVALFLSLVIATLLVSGVFNPIAGTTTTLTTSITVTEISTISSTAVTLPDSSSVIARVRDSVVAIDTEVFGYSIFGEYAEEGAGSGWIIDTDGLIVTNYHVVEGADSVTVTLEDGMAFSAIAVYTDSFSDLAIIKIDAQGLPALAVGDSSRMDVGQWVVAIGNSLGLGISATTGIVSALGVSLEMSVDEALYDLIQTDAAVNPGNSGGPLVNMAGEVIGITSAKISDIGVEGMGYAISINEALPILEQLMANGQVVRPTIGVSVYTVNQYLAMRYNLPVDQGVLVTEVVRNGPADTAGIQAGDVITAVESKEVATSQEMVLTLQDYKAGQEVQVTFYHDNAKQTATVTLGES